MDIVHVLITLFIIGVIAFLIGLIPIIDETFKRLIQGVIIAATVIWLIVSVLLPYLHVHGMY